MWRIGSFLAGLPVGVLGLLALREDPALLALELAALGGGALLLALTSLLVWRGRHDLERVRHVAGAASLGFVALPVLGATWIGLAPGPRVWLGVVLVILAAALWRAARIQGAAGALGSAPIVALLAIALGTFAVVAVAGLVAALAAPPPANSERSASYIWDLDARVAPLPLPRCSERPASQRVILARGAHPRLDDTGAHLWFDAAGPDGRRQVIRLERASGTEVCWTCDEPGNNRRPAPGPGGDAVVFDTDRHASWRHPANTEVHAMASRGAAPRSSRRLTRTPGPDDHALLDPGGRALVWSRGLGGRFDVVSAPIQRGHGGMLLGRASVLASGGAAWIAPVAWSADGHAFAVVRGHPLRPSVVRVLDLGRDREATLGGDLAPSASVAFSGDGAWVALGATRRAGAVGLVPGTLGFLVGRLAALGGPELCFRGSDVRLGPTTGQPARVALGELAAWGEITGVALEPDASGFVLGQRRAGPGGPEERLIEVTLDCAHNRDAP